MSALLALCVLVLGYCYVDKTPTEKAKLKRGNNWEVYAILLKHGLFYILFGIFLTLSAIVLFVIGLSKIGYNVVDFLVNVYLTDTANFSYVWQVIVGVFAASSFVLGWYCLFVREYFLERWAWSKNQIHLLRQLKNQDGLLGIALEAMEKGNPVKISLKSKKIYVGMVYSEQFERMDFDNLIIIPYLSGYRDKDTLKVVFDVNYADFYAKKGLLNDEMAYENEAIAEFRLSVRVSEIESISFFNKETFDEMQASLSQKTKKCFSTELKINF